MYYSIRFIKKLNLDFLNHYIVYQRHHNISKKTFCRTKLIISRGLYSVVYLNRMFNKSYKYGMFSFTRKPFARPIKRSKIKKR